MRELYTEHPAALLQYSLLLTGKFLAEEMARHGFDLGTVELQGHPIHWFHPRAAFQIGSIIPPEESERPMQSTINVSLSNDVRNALDNLTRTEGIAADKIINEAVRQYLFFRRLTLLRESLSVKAQERGINSEDDVFRLIS